MGLFANDDLSSRWSHLIKIGEVSSVDYSKGTARVVFDDDDSKELLKADAEKWVMLMDNFLKLEPETGFVQL